MYKNIEQIIGAGWHVAFHPRANGRIGWVVSHAGKISSGEAENIAKAKAAIINVTKNGAMS